MSFLIRAAAGAALTALVSSASLAQSPSAPSRAPAAASAPSASASAAAPSVSSSSLTYRSAFEGYRGYAEQPVTSWREANDLVGRIGGMAMLGANAGGNTGTPPAPPASDDHSGHKTP